MTEHGATCPEGLALAKYGNINHGVCGMNGDIGCHSTVFPTCGLNYTKVCGQIKGYQYQSPDAFFPFHGFSGTGVSAGIDSVYVYGVSITHAWNKSTEAYMDICWRFAF